MAFAACHVTPLCDPIPVHPINSLITTQKSRRHYFSFTSQSRHLISISLICSDDPHKINGITSLLCTTFAKKIALIVAYSILAIVQLIIGVRLLLFVLTAFMVGRQ
jgi:hypothetical protein